MLIVAHFALPTHGRSQAALSAANARIAELERKLKEAEEPEFPTFALTKKKRVQVKKFRGRVLVDIREWYGEKGSGKFDKPGRKGISLNQECWETLKGHIEDIDRAIENM